MKPQIKLRTLMMVSGIWVIPSAFAAWIIRHSISTRPHEALYLFLGANVGFGLIALLCLYSGLISRYMSHYKTVVPIAKLDGGVPKHKRLVILINLLTDLFVIWLYQ